MRHSKRVAANTVHGDDIGDTKDGCGMERRHMYLPRGATLLLTLTLTLLLTLILALVGCGGGTTSGVSGVSGGHGGTSGAATATTPSASARSTTTGKASTATKTSAT